MAQKERRARGVNTAITRRRARGELRDMVSREEARVMLGVSNGRMSKLLKLGAAHGGLDAFRSSCDERVKLIARAEVERLLRNLTLVAPVVPVAPAAVVCAP